MRMAPAKVGAVLLLIFGFAAGLSAQDEQVVPSQLIAVSNPVPAASVYVPLTLRQKYVDSLTQIFWFSRAGGRYRTHCH